MRIAFGLVVLAWTLTLAGDSRLLYRFRHPPRLPATRARRQPPGGCWTSSEGQLAVTGLLVALTLASLCLIVGQDTRVAAAVVFVGIVSLERRNPFVFNAGDGLIRDHRLLHDARAVGRVALARPLAPGPADLLGVPRARAVGAAADAGPAEHLYLASVWNKLAGDTWNDGTAVSLAVRLEDLQRFEPPDALATSELASNLLTYGTIAIEASLGVLVWNRTLRPYVLALGVCMHLGIDLSLRVGFFGYGTVRALHRIPARRRRSAPGCWRSGTGFRTVPHDLRKGSSQAGARGDSGPERLARQALGSLQRRAEPDGMSPMPLACASPLSMVNLTRKKRTTAASLA